MLEESEAKTNKLFSLQPNGLPKETSYIRVNKGYQHFFRLSVTALLLQISMFLSPFAINVGYSLRDSHNNSCYK